VTKAAVGQWLSGTTRRMQHHTWDGLLSLVHSTEGLPSDIRDAFPIPEKTTLDAPRKRTGEYYTPPAFLLKKPVANLPGKAIFLDEKEATQLRLQEEKIGFRGRGKRIGRNSQVFCLEDTDLVIDGDLVGVERGEEVVVGKLHILYVITPEYVEPKDVDERRLPGL